MDTSFVLTTRNAQVKQAFYRRTDSRSPLAPRQFVVGLVQHPNTGLFQVWISTNGLDVVNVSVRQQIVDAERDVQAIKAVLSSQAIYDADKLTELFQRLEAESDEPPQPLPDELVQQITQAIGKSLAHGS
jgi:hypothetical protein